MNATIEETLLDLFHQVIEDPDRIPAVPTEDWPEDAGQRRLLTGFRDMLERLQQRQQDKLDTQGRFWLAVQGANDGLWDRHIPSDEYHLSTRWKSMLGYEEHEIADDVEEWRKRIHPDDLDRALEAGRAYINGETDTYEIEYRLQHKDGTYRWILARGAALRDENGKAYRLAGSNTDITELVQAQQLLEQRVEERTRELSTLLEVSHNVASTLELKPLLGLILDQLKVVADYTGASILIVEGEELVIIANRGPNPVEQVRQLRFPLERMGLLWEVLCRREPVMIDN